MICWGLSLVVESCTLAASQTVIGFNAVAIAGEFTMVGRNIWIGSFLILAVATASSGSYAEERCWPLNGCVKENSYDGNIHICAGNSEQTKAPGWTSVCGGSQNRCDGVEDIDHIKSPKTGQWFKLHNDNVAIMSDGSLGFEHGIYCATDKACGSC